MKKVSPYDAGVTFWSEMVNRIDSAIYVSAITDPIIRTMLLARHNLTQADFEQIYPTALYEVYCFAAYSSFVAGAKKFVKLLGFDRASWVEFIEGIEKGLRTQVSNLPKQEEEYLISIDEVAYSNVIQYMQTFTKGDAKANVAWILATNKGTLKETFKEYEEKLSYAVSVVAPDGEYPADFMQWCPDATTIYNFAVECAAK